MQTKAKQIKFYFERIYGMGSDEVRSFDCWLDTQGPFLLLDQSNQGAAGCAPYISGQTLVSKALCNYAHPIQVNEKKRKISALFCTPHLFHTGILCKPQAVMEESQKTTFSQTQTRQPLFLIDNQNNIFQNESRFVMGEAEMQSCELLE